MMAPRLEELHRALKPMESIYLHCDPKASHYLKQLLGALFGAVNFRSKITWRRTNVHSDSKGWSGVADILLDYVRDCKSFTWNLIHAKRSPEHAASMYPPDKHGRLFTHRVNFRTDAAGEPFRATTLLLRRLGFAIRRHTSMR
jgi:DNA methylase